VSLLDTFKTYNPVTLAVGCLFVACGFWTVFEVVLHGARTALGGVFIFVLFVLVPVSLARGCNHTQSTSTAEKLEVTAAHFQNGPLLSN
jgi:hypothetical protein